MENIPGGYSGKILRVNLSENTLSTENIDDAFCTSSRTVRSVDTGVITSSGAITASASYRTINSRKPKTL